MTAPERGYLSTMLPFWKSWASNKSSFNSHHDSDSYVPASYVARAAPITICWSVTLGAKIKKIENLNFLNLQCHKVFLHVWNYLRNFKKCRKYCWSFFVAGFLEMFLPIVYLKPSATIKDNENQKSVCNWLLRRTKCLISWNFGPLHFF